MTCEQYHTRLGLRLNKLSDSCSGLAEHQQTKGLGELCEKYLRAVRISVKHFVCLLSFGVHA